MKINHKQLTQLIASKRQKVPESIGDVKGLLAVTLEQIITIPEAEKLETALNSFKQAQKDLNEEISKSTSGLDKQIESLKKQADVLRRNKTSIANRITDCLASDKSPEDHYLQLYKVSNEIRQSEDVIKTLERQKLYPGNERSQGLGVVVFESGIKLIRALVDFKKATAAARDKCLLVSDIIHCYLYQTDVLEAETNATQQDHIRSFAHMNPEAAAYSWSELESLARAEIDMRLKD